MIEEVIKNYLTSEDFKDHYVQKYFKDIAEKLDDRDQILTMNLIPGIIGLNPQFDQLRCNNSCLKDVVLKSELNTIDPSLVNHIIAGCFMLEKQQYTNIKRLLNIISKNSKTESN